MKESPKLLIYCTKDDIFDLMQSALKTFHAEQKATSQTNEPDRGKYSSRIEVCKDWKISLPTLHRLTKDGKIISYRIGGRVLYKNDELETALTEVPNLKYRRTKK